VHLVSLLGDDIGVLRQRSRVAQLHKVGHIQGSPVHPNIGLLHQDCKEVPREPEVMNMTPVKTKAWKDVKQEQLGSQRGQG
jgi:hypothetical protein